MDLPPPRGARLTGRWREWARSLRRSVTTLYLAARHPRTPWYARVLAAVVVGYALSPIDLIPDPIPILGLLDDLVLLPAGIWLTRRLIPDAVWAECRARADALPPRPRSWIAAAVVVALWLGALWLAARSIRR